MNDFLKNLIGIISVLISCYFAKKNIFTTRKIDFVKKQLYCVYLPLFKMIEPYLYKDASTEFIQSLIVAFNNIKSNHYELIDPNLIYSFKLLTEYIKFGKNYYDKYEDVCYYIDKNFEKSRKLLSFPTRGLFYKINNKQFSKDFRKTCNEYTNIIISHLLFPAFFLVFAFAVFESIKFIAEFLKKLFIFNN